MAVTTTKTAALRRLLDQAPRITRLLERPDTQYMGACIVQAPGAWTRMGPTWLVPGVGWVVIGPGVANWGTTSGLAQLATDPAACSPQWHTVGVAICPAPNLVFAATADSLAATQLAEVARLVVEVADDGQVT